MSRWFTGRRGWLTALAATLAASTTAIAVGYVVSREAAEKTSNQLLAAWPGFNELTGPDRAALVRAAIRCPGLRDSEFERCVRANVDKGLAERLSVR